MARLTHLSLLALTLSVGIFPSISIAQVPRLSLGIVTADSATSDKGAVPVMKDGSATIPFKPQPGFPVHVSLQSAGSDFASYIGTSDDECVTITANVPRLIFTQSVADYVMTPDAKTWNVGERYCLVIKAVSGAAVAYQIHQ